jgi:iron(III) transport system substrate-binding protein
VEAFKVFEDKYGIKATPIAGSGNENADKVLAERDTGLYTGDIWMGGLTTITTRMIPKGAFDPIEPVLEWPEVKDASLQFQGKRWFGDPEGKYTILFSSRATPLFSYNTNLVNPDQFQSWQDLLDPKWKGKIVSRDPTSSGIGSIMAFFYFNPDKTLGPEYLRRLYTEQNVTIVNDARQAAEGLALGKWSIFFLPGGNDITEMADQGLPVQDFVRPLKEGGQLAAGGTGTISIFNKPAHPNAAKLFLNWWLSKEGQVAAMTANPLDESLRQDVPKDMLRPEWKAVPGGNYYFTDADPHAQGNQDKMEDYMKTVMASVKP